MPDGRDWAAFGRVRKRLGDPATIAAIRAYVAWKDGFALEREGHPLRLLEGKLQARVIRQAIAGVKRQQAAAAQPTAEEQAREQRERERVEILRARDAEQLREGTNGISH